MGQRSQIYVRINGELKIASYYQWNYGERMISRARWGLDFIVTNLEYLFQFKDAHFIEKLRRVFDVNFDYKDIAISHDLLKDPVIQPADVFRQDNNDGKLLVAVDTDIEAFRLYREAAESAGQAPLPLQEFARELFPRIAADALRRGRE